MPIKILYLFTISFFYLLAGLFFIPFSSLNSLFLLVIFLLVQFSFYAWSFYDFYSHWKVKYLIFPLFLDFSFLCLFYFLVDKIFLLEASLFYFSLTYLFFDLFLRFLFKVITYLSPQKKLVFLVESPYALGFISHFISSNRKWNILATFRYKANHFPPSYKEVVWKSWDDINFFLEERKVDLLVYETPLVVEGLSLLSLPAENMPVVNILSLEDFIVQEEKRVPLFLVNSFWIKKFISDNQFTFNFFIKRSFDIFFALFLLPMLLPLIFLTAIITFLTSRGPIFYSQMREGFNGKPFRIYKFRSMRVDAERAGAQWAKKSDNRITAWGKIMRKLRLDELPQIWNVLKGDMSFVGPRPERPEFTQILKEEIPFYELRNKVKPGLTGWAQINYPYGASVEDAWNKTEYDLFYVHNSSFWQDIKILIKTAQVVLMGKGQ